jgi:hypothetical protein
MGHLRIKCSLSSGSRLHSLQIGETSCWLYFCLLACKVLFPVSISTRKSSLKYLTIQENPTRNTHTIWKTAKLNPRSVAKTLVKVEILTGNNTLQANRKKKKINNKIILFILNSCLLQIKSRVQASPDVPCYTPLIVQGINQLVQI